MRMKVNKFCVLNFTEVSLETLYLLSVFVEVMKMSVRLKFILVFFVAFTSSARAVEEPKCFTKLLTPVALVEYQHCRCYDNIYTALDKLSRKKDFDLSKAKVLYVTGLGGWSVHAILEYENQILDANKINFKNYVVSWVPLKEYFAKAKFSSDPLVREISGAHYLEKFPIRHAIYYFRGLVSHNAKTEIDDIFPVQTLGEWLKSK